MPSSASAYRRINHRSLLAALVLILLTSTLSAQEPNAVATEGTPRWLAGVDALIIKPFFQDNVAFTTVQSDGFSFESFADTDFNYDYTVSPRAWLEYRTADDIGLRATYFQFDQQAEPASGTPPANGFGAVFHPVFGFVNVGTTIPGDVYSAQSDLDVYSIDLEVTKWTDFCTWQLMGSVGVRYASIEQSYRAELRDAFGTLVGALDNQRTLEGFGPTLGIELRRPLTAGLTLFGKAKGSLLFGEQSTTFVGGEDLDLVTPFFTFRDTKQDDLLPIGELQLGADWWSPEYACGQFFVRAALEAQLWSGTGSASSDDGNLGFFGATVGLGFAR